MEHFILMIKRFVYAFMNKVHPREFYSAYEKPWQTNCD